MNRAHRIAATLDGFLTKETPVIVFGAGAILLDPAFAPSLQNRETNDLDFIIPSDRELQVNSDHQFWEAKDAPNRALEPEGLFLSHIFVEHQVVLSKEWQQHLRPLAHPEFRFLRVSRPRTLDLVLSKMVRGDAMDCEDVRFLLTHDPVRPDDIAAAAASATVADVYADVFPSARQRILDVAAKTWNERSRRPHISPSDEVG